MSNAIDILKRKFNIFLVGDINSRHTGTLDVQGCTLPCHLRPRQKCINSYFFLLTFDQGIHKIP